MKNRVGDAILYQTPQKAIGAASAIMGRAQNLGAARAVTGLAVSLILVCEEADVNPRQVLEAAGRQLRDVEATTKGEIQSGAIRDLLREELKT